MSAYVIIPAGMPTGRHLLERKVHTRGSQQRPSSRLNTRKMSDIEALKDVQWLFFDVFGTVVDCKSQ